MPCVVCKNKVDWCLVKEEFEEIFNQADACGVASLTEHEQVVYEGLCCSRKCYDKLQ